MRIAIALVAAVGALGAAACSSLDTTGLPSTDGYTSWPHVTATGNIPGHGDTVRVIYYNDAARTYAHNGHYPKGSVFVKEIHDKGAADAPGALQYVAIMRKVDHDNSNGATVEGGWIFSAADSPGGAEGQSGSCYGSCHVHGPFDRAWLDYGD